jgi:alkanesulfonate monooxygenase SsuD/methylene tetrahydromethanopterin reductase-like flavin-dependent oxidoreductase (luciferase family)
MGDGFFPAKGDVAELYEIARQTAADAGRDPESIEMTGSHLGVFGDDPAAAIEEATEWGMHRMIVPGFMFLGNPTAKMAPFAELIAAQG